eukprot:3978168-Heterocapsa_arctica.AAC.1
MQDLRARNAELEELLKGANKRLMGPYTDSDSSGTASSDDDERRAPRKPQPPAMMLIAMHEIANKDLELEMLRQLTNDQTARLAKSFQEHRVRVAKLQYMLEAAVRSAKLSMDLAKEALGLTN